MKFRIRLTSLRAMALGLVIFLAALSGAGSPAKADIADCFSAVAPMDSVAKLSDIASTISTCGSEATSNPLMAVVMAVMIVLRVEEFFLGADQCNTMVDGIAGALIGAGLKAIGFEGGEIEALILGQISLSMIPVIGDSLMHFTQCGCAVAGAIDDIKAVAEAYIASAQGCKEFATEAITTVASGIFASGWFSHGAGDPGFIDAPPYTCPAGFLGKTKLHNVCENKPSADPKGVGTWECSWDGHSYNATALPPLIYNDQIVPCYCEGGAMAVDLGVAIVCKCSGGQGYNNDGTCKPCQAGQAVGKDGRCRARNEPNEVNNGGSWLTCDAPKVAYQESANVGYCGPKCEDGTKSVMSGFAQCVPACGANAVFDPASKKCTSCTALNQIAMYDKPYVSSAGQCQTCDDGYKLGFITKSLATCEPACAEGSVLQKGVCVDCNKQNMVAVSAPDKGSLGTCAGCESLLEKRQGNSCVPAIDCESWQKVQWKAGGIGAAGGGMICASRCGPGEVHQPVVPGLNVTDGQKTYTTAEQPESCTPCGIKQVLNSAINACVPCSAGNVWHAAVGGKPSYCSPAATPKAVSVPPPVKPVETPKNIPDVIKPPAPVPTVADCPPGRVRSASGRCVLELESDDSSRGGSTGGGRPDGTGGRGTTPLPPARAPTGARP